VRLKILSCPVVVTFIGTSRGEVLVKVPVTELTTHVSNRSVLGKKAELIVPITVPLTKAEPVDVQITSP
jgi:hypothetical protein